MAELVKKIIRRMVTLLCERMGIELCERMGTGLCESTGVVLFQVTSRPVKQDPVLAASWSVSVSANASAEVFVQIVFDQIQSIKYFGTPMMPLWRHLHSDFFGLVQITSIELVQQVCYCQCSLEPPHIPPLPRSSSARTVTGWTLN